MSFCSHQSWIYWQPKICFNMDWRWSFNLASFWHMQLFMLSFGYDCYTLLEIMIETIYPYLLFPYACFALVQSITTLHVTFPTFCIFSVSASRLPIPAAMEFHTFHKAYRKQWWALLDIFIVINLSFIEILTNLAFMYFCCFFLRFHVFCCYLISYIGSNYMYKGYFKFWLVIWSCWFTI